MFPCPIRQLKQERQSRSSTGCTLSESVSVSLGEVSIAFWPAACRRFSDPARGEIPRPSSCAALIDQDRHTPFAVVPAGARLIPVKIGEVHIQDGTERSRNRRSTRQRSPMSCLQRSSPRGHVPATQVRKTPCFDFSVSTLRARRFCVKNLGVQPADTNMRTVG